MPQWGILPIYCFSEVLQGYFMISQKKTALFIDNYKKLDENRKDYIRKLTRKLVEIHCTADFGGNPTKKNTGGAKI
jgi:CO dehydrogenase/acetyl-CoA synthase epsilon subunit